MIRIVLLSLLLVGCTTIEITDVDCDVNQNWPRCRVQAEKVE